MHDKELLEAALGGLEYQRSQIDEKIALIKANLSGNGSSPVVKTAKKRRMSAAARKRIGDATRKRWAEARKQKQKKE
jgi:hypothetical protein